MRIIHYCLVLAHMYYVIKPGHY